MFHIGTFSKLVTFTSLLLICFVLRAKQKKNKKKNKTINWFLLKCSKKAFFLQKLIFDSTGTNLLAVTIFSSFLTLSITFDILAW